jgi:hypothetical protein
MEKKRTQVPQKSAKADILPISIYLVVVLYRHKHCRPQKVELDLACRDSTTTKFFLGQINASPYLINQLAMNHERNNTKYQVFVKNCQHWVLTVDAFSQD